MSNQFTKLPKRADICVKRISDKQPLYITLESFDKSALDTTVYEIIGPVVHREGRKVLVMYKTYDSLVWKKRAEAILSGYTLDGTDRTGTLYWQREQGTDVTLTVSYNCTTKEALATTIQTALAAHDDMSYFDFYCFVNADGEIEIDKNYLAWWSYEIQGKDGFSTKTTAPPMAYTSSKMQRKNGAFNTNQGTVSCYERAVEFWSKESNGKDNVLKSALTSIKTDKPVFLQDYLNTSSYHTDDYCEVLRDFYGEGEDGWKRFMKAQCPPDDFGNGAFAYGAEYAKKVGSVYAPLTYTSSTVTDGILYPAVNYCYNINSDTISKGEFFLPALKHIYWMLSGGDGLTTINKALSKIGGKQLSMWSGYWSCLRRASDSSLYAFGLWGYFHGYDLYHVSQCVPLSLYTLRSED